MTRLYVCSDLVMGFCMGRVEIDPASVTTIGPTIPATSTALDAQDLQSAFLAGFQPILYVAMAGFAVFTVKRLLGLGRG